MCFSPTHRRPNAVAGPTPGPARYQLQGGLVPSWHTTVVLLFAGTITVLPLLGGTTTVVFAGGGGLLLLIQPDNSPIRHRDTNTVLIVAISWTIYVNPILQSRFAGTVV
jgi:hypothetical protein